MRDRVWWWERGAGVLWAGTVGILYLAGAFERLELMSYDWRVRAVVAAPPADRVVIVAIDNPSVKELSTWPWSRGVHARLVDTLVRAGARVIAFDVDFSTARRDEGDRRLAQSVRQADRVVIAAFQESRQTETGAVLEYANVAYPELRRAARAIGSINLPVDPDGVLRRSPVTSTILGDAEWSFAAQIARVFLDADREPGPREPSHGLRLAGRSVRLGQGSTSYIRFFGGPMTFPSVSYADVLADRVDRSVFEHRIILVGATSLELQDLRPTPFPGLMPGVEIQANAIETLLTDSGYHRTDRREVLAAIAVIAAVWMLGLSLFNVSRQRDSRRRALTIAVAGASLLLVIGGGGIGAFRALLFIDVVPLFATAVGQVFASLIAGYVAAERRIEFQTENLFALHQMGEETRLATTIERMADLLFAQTRHLLAIDRLGIDLWDGAETTQRLCRDERGRSEPLPRAVYEEAAVRLRETGAPLVLPHLGRRCPGDEAGSIRWSLFVPLIAQNRRIGMLHAHRHRAMPFNEDDAKLLLTLATQAALNIENGRLLDEVRLLFQRSLEAFSTALDFKDNDTGGHSQRVSAYAIEIGRHMGVAGDDLAVIGQGALLHDIGKIAVPDRVLLKPGKLTEDEWVIMRKHPETGYSMLKTIQIPEPIAQVVRHHHERFDGSGYPQGLRGADIAMGARIFSVADLYDAMTNDRPYRKALPLDQVLAEIRRVAGDQLDPAVVEAFTGISPEVFDRLRRDVQQGITGRRAA